MPLPEEIEVLDNSEISSNNDTSFKTEEIEVLVNNENQAKNKTNKKSKKELIVLTTRPISDEELRENLKLQFGENNMYYKILKEAVDNLTDKYKENIRNIMILIRNGINPEFTIENGRVKSVKFKRSLTDTELENYVISLPIEMYFINDYMENKALDMELAQYLKEFNITEEIMRFQGGTEKERMRAAEFNSMYSIFTSIIKNRVYYNLKNEIDAANKVFEALKKVMTARIEEKKIFGKEQNIGNQKKY